MSMTRRGYLVVLAVASVALAAASVPSPLYDIWRDEMEFGVGAQGVVFGVYALTLVPALLGGSVLAGAGRGWSLLIVGLGLSMVADAIFLSAASIAPLILARGVQGVSVGLVNAAANVLVLRLAPRADQRRASIATAVAVASGLAAGALGSGVLAEYVVAPTSAIFVVHAVLVVLGLLALVAVRRPLTQPAGESDPPAVIDLVQWSLAGYVLCCVAVMAAWAVAAMYLAVGPSYALELIGTDNRALAGATTAALFALACVVEIRSRVEPTRPISRSGSGVWPPGRW